MLLESPRAEVDEEDWSGKAAATADDEAELIRGLGTDTVICGILMVVLGLLLLLLVGLLAPSRVLFLDPLVVVLLEIAEAILLCLSSDVCLLRLFIPSLV